MNRIAVHNRLVELLGSDNVYFQPPTNVRLNYPCVIYKKSGFSTEYANSRIYAEKTKYLVTLIGTEPDSPILNNLANEPYSTFDRHYIADSLHHDVYLIFF